MIFNLESRDVSPPESDLDLNGKKDEFYCSPLQGIHSIETIGRVAPTSKGS